MHCIGPLDALEKMIKHLIFILSVKYGCPMRDVTVVNERIEERGPLYQDPKNENPCRTKRVIFTKQYL